MHKTLSFLDSPGAVRLLMIDFAKAFDRIPHRVVLSSLISKGAPRELVVWLKSYLSLRRQCVKSGLIRSHWFDVKSGVPQGGVLSPVLFAFAIDSLKPKFPNSTIVKFADDVCILHFVRNNEDDNLTEELKHVFSWADEHGMNINLQKTKVLNWQTKQSLKIEPLSMLSCGSPISVDSVNSASLLGLILDNKLSWEDHFQCILSRIRKRVHFLYSLKPAHPSPEVLWKVYCSLIRSVAVYAYPAWCNVSLSRLNKLFSFERRLCKIFNFPIRDPLDVFLARSGSSLAKAALDPEHPLHIIYTKEKTRKSFRLGATRRKVLTRTKRFKSSFIKFV